MKVTLVAGLGYGDEGKGTMVDWLARSAGASLVVRYNGGAQAAHNVVTDDDRHHTFSQLGSATFCGVPTLLSRFMLVNPIALFAEARHLASLGVHDPLSLVRVEDGALVTTPFHMAANRLREMARSGRHGSCGMGIGETMADWLAVQGEALFVRDLGDARRTSEKLRALRDRKRAALRGLVLPDSPQVERELAMLEDDGAIDACADIYTRFAREVSIVGSDFLASTSGHVIFEGAQGVLLDQDFGFQPHTTWTDITFRNALTLLDGIRADVTRLGVVRAYGTRHGAGPFVSENGLFLPLSAYDHNTWGTWQHGFRSGAFDLVATRYALDVIGGVDAIAMTHVDRLDLLPEIPVTTAYETLGSEHFEGPNRIRVHRPFDLAHQEGLTRALFEVRPRYRAFSKTDYAHTIADALRVRLAVTSHGPRASDKLQLALRMPSAIQWTSQAPRPSESMTTPNIS